MKKPSSIRNTRIAHHPNRPFKLVPYSTEWPKLYATKAEVIKDIFGDLAISVEHVGSTAIPGMPAKPQIDILITVNNLSQVRSLYSTMIKSGFTPRGDYTGEGEEYFTEDTDAGIRLTSIHVLPNGHVWADDLVNVRDYLRTHAKERERYAAAKIGAVTDHPGNYDEYYRSKLAVIQVIRQEAADWKYN